LAALLEGGYDLGALALLGLALAALLLVKSLTQAVAGIFDFSLFGYRPLHGIAVSIENGAIAALDDAIKSVEKVAAGFLSGLIDAFGLLIAIPLLLGLGIKAALEYLWSSALKPVIHTITDAIRDTAGKALSKVTALEATVAADLAAAEKYARGQAAAALSDAEAYVETRISTALHTVSGEIGAAVSSAERYADQAVSKLRSAEDAAIGAVASVAAAGIAEAERLARAGVSEAEQLAAAGVTEAERLAQVGITDAIRAGRSRNRRARPGGLGRDCDPRPGDRRRRRRDPRARLRGHRLHPRQAREPRPHEARRPHRRDPAHRRARAARSPSSHGSGAPTSARSAGRSAGSRAT
jgi:hypothetical protein